MPQETPVTPVVVANNQEYQDKTNQNIIHLGDNAYTRAEWGRTMDRWRDGVTDEYKHEQGSVDDGRIELDPYDEPDVSMWDEDKVEAAQAAVERAQYPITDNQALEMSHNYLDDAARLRRGAHLSGLVANLRRAA